MNNQSKISYEPEADVLRIEVSEKPIDHAREIGNFIVHFSKEGLPVYVEILDAKKFKTLTNRAINNPAEAVPFAA